ncbi:CHAP domain-containing protein [Blastomonas sp.]|uniref:CHAP domain-containing protein n=1 Tax=Blastomonas sp. TaxID=1909299 RepID=UPI003593D07C
MLLRPAIPRPLILALVLAGTAVTPALGQGASLQCVPYARDISGIQIYGDAHSWWHQAAGRYERGNRPTPGAVMAFKPHRSMQLGHVASVSTVLDSRRVLLDHANWSPVNGRKGQIERNVLAVDVSPGNDWSEVRVWYAPIGDLGTTHYPIHGFIYPAGKAPQNAPQPRIQLASASSQTIAIQPSKADRKAQRRAEKALRKQQKLFARQQKRLAKQRQQSAHAAPAPLKIQPLPPADPIDELIGKFGG